MVSNYTIDSVLYSEGGKQSSLQLPRLDTTDIQLCRHIPLYNPHALAVVQAYGSVFRNDSDRIYLGKVPSESRCDER